MTIFVRIILFSLLQFFCLISPCQTNFQDSVDTQLAIATGLKKAEAYYNIIFLNLRNDPIKAKRYLEEYESFAAHEDNSLLSAYAQLNRGIYYSAAGVLDSSIYHLEKALEMGGNINNLFTIRTESSLGKSYISLGKPEKGLESLFEALRLLQTNPDVESEIKVRINIMWAYLELKRYKDCIDFGRGAMKLVSSEFNWMLPYIYNNLAASFGAINQIDSARYFIEKCIPIATANNDSNIIANAYFILGTIYTNSENYLLAIDQYQKAKPYREKIGNPLFIVADHYTLADLYAKVGNYEMGVQEGLEGLRLAEQQNLILKFEGVYQALAKNYEGLNDLKNASKYYNLWAVSKDSIYKNATAEAVIEMQTKYETEKKEFLIQEQRLKLERNRIITIGLIVLIVLGILIVILWRSRIRLHEQKLQEQQQRLNQENLISAVIGLQEKERSRFAQDLHDGFGQLITALKIQMDKLGIITDGIPELIQHMHEEIRNVSFALSPNVLVRDGLVPAINELSFRINRIHPRLVNVQVTGLSVRLSADLEIAIYRVCQEWINNILKHNDATRVTIQLIEHDEEIILMIEDNGKGFDTNMLETSTGNGWRNIKSRIQVLKGRVEVDSSRQAEATTFTANIPIEKAGFQEVA